MATVILLRHGRTTANASGTLAGWTPGVHLDERGQEQAARAGERLAACRWPAGQQPARTLPGDRAGAVATAPGRREPRVRTDEALTECHYGDWQGRPLSELAKARCGRPCRPTRPRRPSPAASRCRRCRPARSTPYAGATPR